MTRQEAFEITCICWLEHCSSRALGTKHKHTLAAWMHNFANSWVMCMCLACCYLLCCESQPKDTSGALWQACCLLDYDYEHIKSTHFQHPGWLECNRSNQLAVKSQLLLNPNERKFMVNCYRQLSSISRRLIRARSETGSDWIATEMNRAVNLSYFKRDRVMSMHIPGSVSVRTYRRHKLIRWTACLFVAG